jgi:hypothetical protein
MNIRLKQTGSQPVSVGIQCRLCRWCSCHQGAELHHVLKKGHRNPGGHDDCIPLITSTMSVTNI